MNNAEQLLGMPTMKPGNESTEFQNALQTWDIPFLLNKNVRLIFNI